MYGGGVGATVHGGVGSVLLTEKWLRCHHKEWREIKRGGNNYVCMKLMSLRWEVYKIICRKCAIFA